MTRYYRTPAQRLYHAGGRAPRVVPCKRCGGLIRWGWVESNAQWIPLDATADPSGPWALSGGCARPAHRAAPGADWSRHHRHVCETAR